MRKRSTRSLLPFIATLLGLTRALPICNSLPKRGYWQCHAGVRIQRFRSEALRNFNRRKRYRSSALFSGNNINDTNGGVPFLFRKMTRKNFVTTAFLLLIPPLVLEVYSRLGSLFIENSYSFLRPPKDTTWSNVESVTVVFHGAGGQDKNTDSLMKRLNQRKRSYNHIVDWSKYSANILQASHSGQRIGKITANELLEQVGVKNSKLKTIHFIGISVGAFAADAAVNEVKKIFEVNSNSGGNPPFVQLTLLDPFQQLGVLGIDYGSNEFGKSADYTEQYLNTDDPVPSTTKQLRNAVCYDVTNLRPESIFGHDWPLVYYTQSDRCGQLIVDNQNQENPRGKIGTAIVL